MSWIVSGCTLGAFALERLGAAHWGTWFWGVAALCNAVNIVYCCLKREGARR